MRQTRFLLGWMAREEAVNCFLGRPQVPTDNVADYAARWEAAQQVLQGREPFNLPAPALEELPRELAERANAFRARPDVVVAFQSFDWTIGIADLEHVLSFQKTVTEEHALDRVAGVEPNDVAGLFSICLPDPAAPISPDCAVDPDGKGLTFFSPNPNLRFGGHVIQQAQVPAAPGQPAQNINVAGFLISYGTPFIQIAEFNGRWFVRDGYHRCYGFLRRGIRRIPCVFIRARSLDELGANQPAFIRPEVLFGVRPPFVKDFLDERLSSTAQHREIRKIFRVTAQEFAIQL